MSQRDDAVTLRQIAEAATKIRQWLRGVSPEDFYDNEFTQSAVMHQITIIGEAAGRLTPEFRTVHADLLPWAQMKAMRNILIHGYDEVQIERVWTVATDDLPKLALRLQDFLGREDDRER